MQAFTRVALVGAVLTAGHRWLNVYCPGCRQVAVVDLELVDRNPQAALTSLILWLRCRHCLGNAPIPELRGVSHLRPDLIQFRKGSAS